MNEITTATEPSEPVSKDLDAFLRATNIVDAINENLPDGLKLQPIPKEYVLKKIDREAVSVAMHAAMELSGGLPALVQWAAKNPNLFFPMWSKLAQSETATPTGSTYVFNSAIPPNALDLVSINSVGRVFKLPADEVPE